MSINQAVIFAGPTISFAHASTILEAVYLPPVSQGDIYRLRTLHPAAIGVIDGYFEGQPAVWHKEILWALSNGISVFGASSMGALRAVELKDFGMRGVGRIYRDFISGVLEDDDEVTVVHGSAEFGYRAASDAMVNIRYTLQAAADSGVIDTHLREELCEVAKKTFYIDRFFPLLIDKALSLGLPEGQLRCLAEWLPANYVNQKREDAVQMLVEIRDHIAGHIAAPRPNFVLEPTLLWQDLTKTAGVFVPTVAGGQHSATAVTTDDIITEMRLLDRPYHSIASDAWLKHLLIQSDHRHAVTASPEGAAAVDSFRKQMRLEDDQAYEGWLVVNDLDSHSVESMLLDDALVASRYSELKRHIPPRMLEELKLRGEYARYRTRAALKLRVLQLTGIDDAFPVDWKIGEEELLKWHFQRLGRPLPDDLLAYIRGLDIPDKEAFLRAIVRERAFLVALEGSGTIPEASEPRDQLGRPGHTSG